MKAGSVLFPEAAPPALWLLLTGEVVLESSSGQPPVTARAGDIIGSVNVMAGRSLGRSAKVVQGGIALKIDREDLFDFLAERADLLRQMFASMFRRERPADRARVERALSGSPGAGARLRLAVHLLLSAKDAAPLFVLGYRHAALDAHADPLFWLCFLRKELRQERHDGHRLKVRAPTRRPPLV